MARNSKKATAAAKAPSHLAIAKTSIEHDLEPYEVGDELLLTSAELDALIAVGAVEYVGPAEPEGDAGAGGQAGEPGKTE